MGAIRRRSFLRTSTLAATGIPAVSASNAVEEPARSVPVVEQDDVIVCGGGPAGVAAAIAAARAGAATRLIESQGTVGGIWTVGLMTELSDAGNKKGIVAEIIADLTRLGGWRAGSFDPEIMKLVLERKCREAAVKVRLHTMAVGAIKDRNSRVTHVITESKSGREAWAAKTFVDASGDGDLAAFAGCGFDFGHPQTREFQPFSMRVTLAGIGDTTVAMFTDKEHRRKVDLVVGEIERGGVSPSYTRANFFVLRHGVANLMANHEYGYSPLNAEAVTKASMEAREEIHRIVAGLRSLGGIWKELWVAGTSEMIGMRESRRIHGLYTLTADDAVRGARFPDAVCRATYTIDIHSPNPKLGKGVLDTKLRMKPFDIPLRSLIAKDVANLLTAGRCIGGDHFAHGSYRITGNASATGEAAGKTAAISARTHRLPKDVPFSELGLPPIDGPAG